MPPNSAPAPLERLIVATGNPGKLRELGALLAGLPFVLESQTSLGIVPVPETGTTFLENALLKARHASAMSGAAALADDSGLEVQVLGGAPGIFSARYAGEGASDAANNAKLMRALEGHPAQQRRARYRCAMAFVSGAADAVPLTAEGEWEGIILDAPRGSGGFGYDPYFWLPDLQLTAAELDPERKNQLSHRGIALRKLRAQLVARHAGSGAPCGCRA